MAAQVGYQRFVADADSEHETAARKLGDGLGCRRHRQRVARIDIGDAGGGDLKLAAGRNNKKEPITTDKVRLRITQAPVSPALSEFGLYAEPE